ncbi:MAG TPA: patatin [Aminobacterium sp.]|jgi:NTE family protein|uniref:patatin-like phospholipase family protein n=1 Tax=Aminobacterium TaxID=81466 RepID=UPI000EF015B4|nr:patatin-like phospholipase family protein [Aminobacterium sp. UBA4834]HCA40498.1 patatin [Aminobacterium sp.]
MKTFIGNKKIGLALGGGAVLGAAHIGVLKAFEECNIPVSYIAGTSIGAFISAFFAFGKRWEEIREIARGLNWLDISGISLSQFGLLSNKKLGQLIIENLGNVTFDEAHIPVAMVAADITSGEKVVLKKGDVATAVTASTCIPGVFVPVEINNQLLVDGGIVENVPITPLKEMGADLIIGVDLNAKHGEKRPENIIEVLLRSFDIALKTATKLQTEEADILIKPDLFAFNMIDTGQTEALIEKGYFEARKTLENII